MKQRTKALGVMLALALVLGVLAVALPNKASAEGTDPTKLNAENQPYSGSAQQLISAGTKEGGTYRYFVTDDSGYSIAENTTPWSVNPTEWTSDATAITGTDAKTYYVWWAFVPSVLTR